MLIILDRRKLLFRTGREEANQLVSLHLKDVIFKELLNGKE